MSSSPPPKYSPPATTVITVDQKNALADETNPVLTILPAKFPVSTGFPVSAGSSTHSRTRRSRVGGFFDGVRRRFAFANDDRISTVCLPLIVVWLLIASFFAGLLFYRYFYSVHGEPTFYGWCGTNFMEQGRPERITQKLEIDPNQLYERIQVPKFGLNRPAIFVHDFRKNVTAIVDVLGNRCFIKDLDRSLVAPPKNFIDLIEKMENGYYAQSPRVVRETFRVAHRLSGDELDEMESPMVTRHCVGREIYRLERASKTLESPYFVRDRRSIRQRPSSLQFSVMNGENVEVEKIVF
ncbi:G01D9.4 protein [Aphelenchoides avenae]|nr:G01D9.4 protein [Aphelenchus avenae]